jgi:serine protease Do
MRSVLLSLTIIAAIASSAFGGFGEDLTHKSVTVLCGKGVGSGVIYKKYGRVYVWTCAHVVGYSPKINVYQDVTYKGVFHHRNESKAKVLSVSYGRDLALLEVDDPKFGASSTIFRNGQAEMGEDVWAVGSMFGPRFHNSLTKGIISYNGRNIEGQTRDQADFYHAPGSSGGPVFDKDGKCVGLVSMTYGPGLGIFVPVRVMREWAELYIK